MGTVASANNGSSNVIEPANESNYEGGFLGGLMESVNALASAAINAGNDAAEAAVEALDSSYVVDGKPIRTINSTECKYFNTMNTISKIAYIENHENIATYLSANNLGYAMKSIKVYEIDSTRAIAGEFELSHKSWRGMKKCFIVAFRGTKLQDTHGNWMVQDVIHDLTSAVLCEFKDSTDVLPIGYAGLGFVIAYNKLRKADTAPCNTFLSDIVKGAKTCPGGLIITGHSLGGALATLCAVDLLKSHDIVPKLITFGAPRVFKPSVARHIDSIADFENVRIINHGDPIPLLPPSIIGMYRHCGHAYFYKVPKPIQTEEEIKQEVDNAQRYKDNLLARVHAKATDWMAASADKSHGEWCHMDHSDFHGEFPDVMKALLDEMQQDSANLSSILIRVLLEIDICCHDVNGYEKHLVGYMHRAAAVG